MTVGDVKGDRNDLYAQKGGEELVQKVSDQCGGDVIVVIHAVGPVLVESFIDTIPTPSGPVYGGTLAPTLRLDIRDKSTYFVEQLGYGYIPATQ